MDKVETYIKGVEIIIPTIVYDERGSFSEICNDKFPFIVAQQNQVKNIDSNIFRGLHLQVGEFGQKKVVMCVKGSILDVVLDIRPNSPTFGLIYWIELNEKSRKMIFIDSGLAHGYLTLVPDTEVIYSCSSLYEPKAESGVRLNDPKFNISLVNPVSKETVNFEQLIMSDKDKNWPLWK